MSQFTEEKNIIASPELCTKCQKMYGHETFDFMCSKCYKQKKQNQEQFIKKETLTSPVQNIRKNTEIEQALKSLKSEEKEQISPKKKETSRMPETKTQRQRTRQKQEKKPQNKCHLCSKKTGNLGYECRHCLNNYCKFHRLPQQHKCEVDFISAGKKLLIQANPEVKTRKLSQIE